MRAISKYFTLINLVLLSGGIFFITHIISFNIGKRLEPPAFIKDIKDTAGAEKEQPRPFEAYHVILDRNIFNSKRSTENTPLPVPGGFNSVKVEVPSIPIKLMGTVAGNPSYAYAIIEDPVQKGEKIFRVDDTIAPGIKLAEINRNMIVIMRDDGGREEINVPTEEWYIRMVRQIKQSAIELLSPESESASATPYARNNPDPVRPAQVGADSEDGSRTLSKGMGNILAQAKLVQQSSGGQSEGFMIHSIEPGSLFDKVGLKDGDLITGVNGLDLNDPKESYETYKNLKGDDFIIVITRGENKITLNSPTKEILALFSLL